MFRRIGDAFEQRPSFAEPKRCRFRFNSFRRGERAEWNGLSGRIAPIAVDQWKWELDCARFVGGMGTLIRRSDEKYLASDRFCNWIRSSVLSGLDSCSAG